MLASELLIMRYAEATCDVEGVVGGTAGDTGVTAIGRIQAAYAAASMAMERAEQPYSVVYTGQPLRLVQTGVVVAAVLGVPLRREATLSGQRCGTDFDGQPWSGVVTALGGLPIHVPDRPLGNSGETWNGYVSRLERALRRLTGRHPGQRIVVIGEEATIDASLRLFLDARDTGRELAGSESMPTGMTRWREQPPRGSGSVGVGLRWALVQHNVVRNLPRVLQLQGVTA